jgi:hypothetical protein
MDEIYELYRYLPIFPQKEQEYVQFLKEEIQKSFKAGAYQSAYLTAHMIFMFYVYCCIWKIKQTHTKRYSYGIIGFPKYRGSDDVDLKKLDSLFDLSLVAEKTVFDIFQLIEMDKSEITKLKKAVDKRNNIAHSTGQITFSSPESFMDGIVEMVNHCEKIQRTMEKKVIRPAYEEFLQSNNNQDDWEYGDINEQVQQVLLYGHKLSQIELRTCTEFGICRFKDRDNYTLSSDELAVIKQLHERTTEIYSAYFGADESA